MDSSGTRSSQSRSRFYISFSVRLCGGSERARAILASYSSLFGTSDGSENSNSSPFLGTNPVFHYHSLPLPSFRGVRSVPGVDATLEPNTRRSQYSRMNCEVFYLKELEVEHHQIKEVLRCVLHTIMFNRALGLVRPKDVDSDLFDITYVQCGDASIEKKIDEKIDNFLIWVEKHPNKKSQVCLSFYETRNKQLAWFSSKTERLYWEQWCIHLNVVQTPQFDTKPYYGDNTDVSSEETVGRKAALEAVLREVILQILKHVNEKKEHIPPILRVADVVSFPYEISIPSSSDSSFGMDMFKRILQTTPPAMLS